MRKFVCIMSGLVACLLFCGGGFATGSEHPVSAFPSVTPACEVMSLDERCPSDEWLCEYACNSDLNFPRVCCEMPASWSSPAQPRTAGSQTARAAVRRLAAQYDACAREATSFNEPFDPSVGPHAVDYYVFRLRRLII